MEPGKTPIIFFGNERLATGVTTSAPTLKALVAAGYNVVAVVSNYTEPNSRNARGLEIQAVAEKHNIPILLPKRLLDIKHVLEDLRPTLGVLVAYGKIVPQDIIDIFPRGIVNIHPSLLPLHRGPTPIESVILNGELGTGVSLMKLVRGMDAGPVFAQTRVTLSGKETKQELALKLLGIGRDMLIEHLPAILSNNLRVKPQDDSKATYDNLLTKASVDWKKSAIQIEREVRAFAEWPKSHTVLAGKDIAITGSHVARYEPGAEGGVIGKAFRTSSNSIGVVCGEDVLLIDKVRPAGRVEMTAQAFLAGYGSRL